jgi:putative AdoMet-dependent methyltransferase
MIDLVPPSAFDDWAASYDRSVNANSGFPFDGYSQVLQTIVDLAAVQPGATVLDLGIGTGNLALPFAKQGCALWGLDFSSEMLALAQAKLPGTTLAQVDLRAKWPPAFQRRFDCIVSAYTFHHFLLKEKIDLAQRLLNEHLSPGGRLIIGDIAFRDAAEEDTLRRTLGPEWEQEYYWLADESLAAFTAIGVSAHFIKISSCTGIFQFNPE